MEELRQKNKLRITAGGYKIISGTENLPVPEIILVILKLQFCLTFFTARVSFFAVLVNMLICFMAIVDLTLLSMSFLIEQNTCVLFTVLVNMYLLYGNRQSNVFFQCHFSFSRTSVPFSPCVNVFCFMAIICTRVLSLIIDVLSIFTFIRA